jgi:hypothetical protein
MKFRFVVGLFLLLSIAAGTASAQTAIRSSIKGGINFSTVTGDAGDVSKSMRIGGAFGGGVSVMINDKITFDPEVLYSMEGVKVKFSGLEGTSAIDFVRIPLLLRIGAGSGARAGYIVLGPAIGIVTRAKNSVDGGESEDFKSELKSTDLAIVFGAGVQANKFFFEGRYMAGLTDLSKESGDDSARSQVVGVLLGARF